MKLITTMNDALCCSPLGSRQRAFLFCAVLFALGGCITHRPALPTLPPVASATEYLRLVAARYDSLRDHEVRATIDLTIDGVRERRARALVRHRLPSDLKLVVGGFGYVVMAARAQADTLYVHLPRQNHYLVGQPEAVLHALTGVDLSHYAVDRAILGLPNFSPLDVARATRFDPGQEHIFLEFHAPHYLHRLWIEARTGLLREEKVYDVDGHLVSARRLSDYRMENGFALPRHIEIQQGRDVIFIQVESRAINTGLSDKAFALPIPKDATRHEIR